ncbi:MAG: 5'-nucleotidase C-terminal domain-containing protein [Balneolales bacterium]|nr:5'-nucleotidase C-terminal domain-containing protein [Balneolales bacterium]
MIYKSSRQLVGLIVTIVALALPACVPFWETSNDIDFVHEVTLLEHNYLKVSGDIDPDAEVTAFIREYAAELNRTMNRRITVSRDVIERGQPESGLGNLTADILRHFGSRELGNEVDIAILNRGGLRIPIPEGNVTVGTMFELMPFENYVTLLKFSGTQILQLANELAIEGGEPVSGLRMRIADGRAVDLLVGDDRVNPSKTYWVATNNWMADGGGPLPTLWEPLERRNTDILIRDAFIEYLNTQAYIETRLDGRIRK